MTIYTAEMFQGVTVKEGIVEITFQVPYKRSGPSDSSLGPSWHCFQMTLPATEAMCRAITAAVEQTEG